MPEPGGPTLDEVEATASRRGGGAHRSPAPASPGSRADPGERARSRAAGCSRAVVAATGGPGPGSKIAAVAEPTIDVSIEHKHAPPPTDGKQHPNTCPGCGSHYRDDELERAPAVCPQCGHHFPVEALDRVAPARRCRLVGGGGGRAPLRRSARLLRPAAVHASGSPRRSSRPGSGDAMVIGRAAIEERPCRARGHGLLVHGRLDGERRRREVRRAPATAPRRHGVPLVSVSASRRRAHAGGDPRAHAAAEDRLRRRGAARRRLRADLRARPSDDRRRARELRKPRRRPARRAGRAHVVRRPPRRRADDAREAARRLRPRRVEPSLRARRRDRAACGAAAERSDASCGCSGSRVAG